MIMAYSTSNSNNNNLPWHETQLILKESETRSTCERKRSSDSLSTQQSCKRKCWSDPLLLILDTQHQSCERYQAKTQSTFDTRQACKRCERKRWLDQYSILKELLQKQSILKELVTQLIFDAQQQSCERKRCYTVRRDQYLILNKRRRGQ